jgi:sulfur carrier protein ThiS/N-acetylglutamate synthase-like GNAT family acetyltransferase
MEVTVDVVGGDEREYTVDDDATYADLIRAAGYHPQEASVLVDGAPVPGDRPVDAERVRLLRLIRGGAGDDPRESRDHASGVAVEPATAADRLDVLRVLDAAMLATDAEQITARIDAGDVLVARFERTGAVVGALVTTRPEPGRRHVDAVAVRRARRGRGIGSALVASAVARAERDERIDVVTAAFEPHLEGFYAELGFDINEERAADGRDRLRGLRRADA